MDEYLGAFRSSSCGQERVRLEKEFNACNLERIAGLQIEWTMNLADHLQLTDEENKVSIFCYASFLECQLKSTIFPKGFIAETLRTIRLLIPQTEKQTKQWFEKKCLSAPHLDQKVLKCGRLRAENRRIEDFEFWREQLVILKQYSDEAEPNTISQWWCDRRKRVQWYTFWVAMLVLSLTIFFGLIECVKGALQVYKAFNN
ncbi:hypothetical protein SS1G_13687 [Sclerotinia sclerotiorum 1980 UF-70]|nr:hypothetical protein SS1G_13687 [Sclerotinia sclerotiorum 1980 UF-70]EDN98828.1 hypothetical protein SS1G_13687 [Sclerotinia sclerotiorum 1980 UF-70]